jgi:LDH2 family malate/lactate/ureidoglycolate dehydrogenase
LDTLFTAEKAAAEISRTVEDLRNYGGPTLLLPGEKELRQRRDSLENGIRYTPAQIKRLEGLGSAVGLPGLDAWRDPNRSPG